MGNNRISKEDTIPQIQLDIVCERFECQLRALLLLVVFRHLRKGGTMAELAARIRRKEKWLHGVLFGRTKLTIDIISDVLLSIGAELAMKVVRIDEAEKSSAENAPSSTEREANPHPPDVKAIRRAALEEAAKIVDDHYWDSTGAVGKAHGDALAKMIRSLIRGEGIVSRSTRIKAAGQ